MSLWSLGFPGPLTLHGLLCIPICLPGLLCLLCLVLVPLLCLPVHWWSPGLTCGAICMPAWSPMALHAFLVSVCPCLVCLSVPGHLNLILVLLYSLLCIGFVEHFMCTLMISYAMYLDTYFKKACTECHSYALIVCLH